MKNGEWKAAVEEKLTDVPVEYLPEVVGSNSTGNIFTLTVMHYDADQAAKISKVIDEQIQKYAASTLKENGDFHFLLFQAMYLPRQYQRYSQHKQLSYFIEKL